MTSEKLLVDDYRQHPGEIIYSITDLISLEKLQKIQDAFAASNNVASTLTDPEGRPITELSNHSAVCRMIRDTPDGLDKCVLSGKQLGQLARERRTPVRQGCASIGFTDAAAPIIVNGRHIANWIMGQYHVGEVDEQRVRDYALEIGADPVRMISAFRKMPKISSSELDAKLDFLGIMANELSEMAYRNLVERRQTHELHLAKAALQQQQQRLEILVSERTTELEQVNRQLVAKIAEKSEIQQQQSRLITAIESAVEAIVVTSPTGIINYINPAFTRLTGYTSEEAIGQTPRLLKSGRHDDTFYRDLWQTVTSGEVWAGHFINKKKDGSLYHEEATIAPVKDACGQITDFVAVKRDITKERELESQLRQAQRLESLGRLAAGIAHEINSPIHYILANTHYAREAFGNVLKLCAAGEPLVRAAAAAAVFPAERELIARTAQEIDIDYLREETDAALAQTIEGIDRIATIVDAMRKFSQTGSEGKHPEDLNALISSVIVVSRPLWQDVAELTLDLDPDLPVVLLDAPKIKDVLLGMLTNAADALTEKLGPAPRQKGMIALSTRRAADQAEIVIADNGAGITPELLDKIFDPFFTTKPVGKGRGQGLSVAHGIIVDHHLGAIRAQSSPGEGAQFTIVLPLS
ncbi:MAG: PocR ligand-binding domain-containing protein [Desulfofustis sp.]|nr:PocR ligand-binding domain-containing protein [Desulfofustis sp.]